MTENECIKSLNGIYPEWCSEKEEYEMAQVAIKALEKIQKFEAIGTIEEFKALKEKSVAKKVNIQQWIDTKCDCGYEFSKHHGDGYYSIPYEKQTKYCPECGQKLDFAEEE